MDSLPLLIPILKRRALPAIVTIGSAVAIGLVYTLFTKPVYTASTRLLVDDRSVSVSELGQAITDVQSSIPSGANLLATQSELVKSEQVLQRAVEQLNFVLDGEQESLSASSLRSNLSVKVVPATNILEFSYPHPDPEVAAIILNQIAEAVIAEGVEAVRSEATALRRFLESKIPQQEASLRLAEEAESRYRQETGIVDIDTQTENLIESLTQLENQERDLVTQLQEARVRDAMLQDVTGVNNIDQAYRAVRVGQDEEINQLETQLLALESAVIESQSRLGPQHPNLLALLEQRDEVRELYRQEISEIIPVAPGEESHQAASDPISQDLATEFILGSFERNALEETLNTVQAERGQLEDILNQIPQFQQPLAALVREREEAASALSLLRNKLEEARIAEAQLVNNIQLVDQAAVPTSPSSSPLVSLVVATVAGLLSSLAVILLLETLDDRLHDGVELEALVDLPLLGTLPKNLLQKPDLERVMAFLDQPQWTEPYRWLVKTMEFHSQVQPDQKTNVFVVSGLSAQEGQSLTVTNLAAVASQMSRRTLVIDSNWQQPLQHLFFSVRPRPGLVDILKSPKHAELDGVHSSVISDLDVFPIGANDPSIVRGSFAESPAFSRILRSASAQYDFILVAAPPLADSADAATLSSYGAGLVLVVQANMTSRSTLKRAVTDLKKSGTKVLGLVIAQTPDLSADDYPYLEVPERYDEASVPSTQPGLVADWDRGIGS